MTFLYRVSVKRSLYESLVGFSACGLHQAPGVRTQTCRVTTALLPAFRGGRRRPAAGCRKRARGARAFSDKIGVGCLSRRGPIDGLGSGCRQAVSRQAEA